VKPGSFMSQDPSVFDLFPFGTTGVVEYVPPLWGALWLQSAGSPHRGLEGRRSITILREDRLDLDMNEWAHGCWPARQLREPGVSSSPECLGTLILTNRRLVFGGRAPVEEFAAAAFDELT
jgi:hypothetical protein